MSARSWTLEIGRLPCPMGRRSIPPVFRAGRNSSSVILATIVAIAGGTLDLCACDATSHGFLCPETAASHCGPAEQEPAEPSCCSTTPAQAEESPQPAPEGPQVRAPRCDCPVIDLQVSPTETPDLTSVRGSTPVLVATVFLEASPAPPTRVEALSVPPWWDAGPPSVYSSSLSRHLELRVLRC